VSTELRIMRLPHGADLPLPAYQSALAAGLDLLAAVAADAPVAIAPGARALIPTGIAIALPPNSEGQIRPRSGMAIHHGVTVLNAPGTIDPDFRGELQVVLVNHGAETVVITRAMRIAQLVIAPIQHVVLVECDELNPTARQSGGFGSTGIATDTVIKHS
jgi:dUTP pyrophosphatase